ncbi:MAG: malto-oligosyltrehalose synthase, partial [Egibacteraceae bacterium]
HPPQRSGTRRGATLMKNPRRHSEPRATYRLQLTPEFGFAEAAGLIDYLADLGISHLYLSPVLQARPGSAHGYDVADPTRVSQQLGGEEGLRALAAAAHARDLGLIVDIVPNHVAASAHTPLWEALLTEGPGGDCARFFDVDWDPPLPGAAGKVIVPALGDQYGLVLQRGELEVSDGRVRYFEHSFPLSAQSRAAMGGLGLHELLERQHYRLVWHRVGDALINYRRFFAISELAGVRVEDEHVFDVTHERVLALVADGVIDGLRVDHPDGLADPRGYLRRLADRAPGTWIVVEKILAAGEPLPEDWPVAGTTGYDFCNDVTGLFVDPAAAGAMEETGCLFSAVPEDRQAAARAAKAEILDGLLSADTKRVAARLWAVCQAHPEIRDVDDRACLRAVASTVQALPFYRTYVDPVTGKARPEDERVIEAAVPSTTLGAFLADVLTGRAGTDPAHLEVIRRFQQLSGATMAKGVEDTYFYRDLRLLAVNEVGAEPGQFGIDVDGFHAACAARGARHPTGMLATATHDTNRGEDTRLRIAALSEMPAAWDRAVRGWAAYHRGIWPDPAAAYLLYQTLVGVWPLDAQVDMALGNRVREYAIKAVREAKLRTDWTDSDEAYEGSLVEFVDLLLDPERSAAFHAELAELAGRAAVIAMVASLAQTLLRCTVPGVPDTYQGAELWDCSLVDPDNRRPVDFDLRHRLLASLDGADPRALLAQWWDGRIKLWVLSRALHARATHPACVGVGSGYEPLPVGGRWADHAVAFVRPDPHRTAFLVTVAPRLPGAVMSDTARPPVGDAWADTALTLPVGGQWTDLLTGATHHGGLLPLSDLLRTLPVALLAYPDG